VMDLSKWETSYEFEAEGARTGDRQVSPQCLAWNPSAHEGMALVVGMSDGSVHLWSLNEPPAGGWVHVLALTPHHGSKTVSMPNPDCIRDLSWAPDVGRSKHIVATASRDKSVKIWELLRTQTEEEAAPGSPDHAKQVVVTWSGECTGELLHDSQVWRVEWNSCGSMLAAGVDDGHVHVYSRDGRGGWKSEQQSIR